MRPVLVDSGAVLALLNRDDAHHGAAVRVLNLLLQDGDALFTTNLLVAETYTLVLRELGAAAARRWLNGPDTTVLRVNSADERRAMEILNTPTGPGSTEYHPFSYFDATSFAVMERLDCRHAFTFDKHFRLRGFSVLGL